MKYKVSLYLFFFLLPHFAMASVDFAEVQNETGYPIYFLHIVPANQEWATDMLGDRVILNNQSLRISLREYGNTCSFNLKAVDKDDDTYFIWDKNLCEDNKITIGIEHLNAPRPTQELTPYSVGGAGGVRVFNQTGFNATKVFISPTGTEWGNNKIGNYVLADKQSIFINLLQYGNTCQFDMRLQDVENDTYTLWNSNLCASAEVVFTLEQLDKVEEVVEQSNPSLNGAGGVRVINDLFIDIVHLYISPSDTIWDEDKLGNEVLPQNRSFFINLTQYGRKCVFDIKAVDVNDTSYILWNHNLCANPLLKISPEMKEEE